MTAFQNVMGYDSLKQELLEIIDVMQNEDLYQSLGVSCPNGMLLYGEPGVGKTLLASEFIEASGRPSVICRKNAAVQSFIDTICESFDEAVACAPSILLLDDMDKFANDDEDHVDSEAFVTIQSCIDSVKGKGVFVLATANNIHKLPRSLRRTGRFDRKIEVPTPGPKDSELIISHYLQGKNMGDELDANTVAALLRGSTCSSLETIINQAGMLAGYRRADRITMDDLIRSHLMITHHVPRGCVMGEAIADIYATDGSADTVWHEAGHVAMNEILVPGSVSIAIATSGDDNEHGFVEASFRDSGMNTLERIKASTLVSLASLAAMDIAFGRVDPGAESDVDKALGSIRAIISATGGFAGLSLASSRCATDDMDMRREIAASAICELFYQEAKELLCKNRSFLEAIAQALAEKTVITAEDIAQIRAEHAILAPLA